ncbi:hypothetical protein BD413DRAFT_90801 [Trametes elegans]|nr:hypothetical protein BD413DRAFT_90801 [Trametes elegans]
MWPCLAERGEASWEGQQEWTGSSQARTRGRWRALAPGGCGRQNDLQTLSCPAITHQRGMRASACAALHGRPRSVGGGIARPRRVLRCSPRGILCRAAESAHGGGGVEFGCWCSRKVRDLHARPSGCTHTVGAGRRAQDAQAHLECLPDLGTSDWVHAVLTFPRRGSRWRACYVLQAS